VTPQPPRDPAERRPDPVLDLDLDPDLDPGLARARTSLAWTRTALAFAALGGAALKKDVLPGLAIMVLAVVVWRLGQLPHRLPGRLKLVTATIVAVALAALVITLTS
jgi:uncharacterized membrane protein YidH (DUF202 family)